MNCNHTVHNTHSHFGWNNAFEPILQVEPGESVAFEVLDASGGQLNTRSSAQDVGSLDFSKVNPVTGPIYVNGAKPGDVLVVEILEFELKEWGWTAIIPGFGLLAEHFTEPYVHIWDIEPGATTATFNDRFQIPLAPFPGTIGVAPAETGDHSIVPPRGCGGNMDIRHLTADSTLLLPVQVEGALFSVGDTHAAQGDGEVCGTAIESPMQIALRFGLRRDLHIEQPQFMVPGPLHTGRDPKGYYATTGIADDLMEATRKSVRAMIDHLSAIHELSEADAYALSSVCVDLKISEVVDSPNWVVSAFLPQSIVASYSGFHND